MSLLLRKALGVITVTALATTLLSIAPAYSREAAPRADSRSAPRTLHLTAMAKGRNHFNGSIDVTIPPGGNATVTSPTLDPNMTAATVTYTPLSAYQGFVEMAFTLL